MISIRASKTPTKVRESGVKSISGGEFIFEKVSEKVFDNWGFPLGFDG